MALHKAKLNNPFHLPICEKHFHDHDETWIIVSGRGTGYWIRRDGLREEFLLEAGDVWMIPAGYEHGSDGFAETGRNSDDFRISTFNGSLPEGSHKPGHYYVEQAGYIPHMQVVKTPTDRYSDTGRVTEMRGVMFPEYGRTELQTEPVPVVQDGHILCRTLWSGLTNGTERNVMLAGNYGGEFPRRHGYQNVGVVVERGGGVNLLGYKVGDVIFCGAFKRHVEYFTVDVSDPANPHNITIKLPPAEQFDPKLASLFGIASVAMHDVRRVGVKFGEKVLVVGAGLVGQFMAQAARLSGAIVTVCDLDQARLDLARECGADHVVRTAAGEGWNGLAGHAPFDVVIETSGADVFDEIVGLERGQGVLVPRGRVLAIGGRHDVRYKFNAGQFKEIVVMQATHFVQDDLEHVLRLALDERLKIKPLINAVVPIEECVAVYDRLRDDPASMLGVVFDWTGLSKG